MPDDETDYAGEALAASRPPRSLPPVQPRRPDTSPNFSIMIGIVSVIFGGFIAGVAGGGFMAAVGSIIVVLGLVVAGIGVVAAGVRLGHEWTDYDRAMRER